MNHGDRIRRMDNGTLAYLIAAMLQEPHRNVAKILADAGVAATIIEPDIDTQAAHYKKWLDQEAKEEA